jgi:hypothetical protein
MNKRGWINLIAITVLAFATACLVVWAIVDHPFSWLILVFFPIMWLGGLSWMMRNC